MITGKYYREFDKVKDETFEIEDIDPRLKKKKLSLPCISEEDDEWHKEHKATSINGYWYDVTNFIPYHPGGNIIEKFLRCDATTTFYGMHPFPEKILAKRFPVARHVTNNEELRLTMKEARTYWRLHTRYTELG